MIGALFGFVTFAAVTVVAIIDPGEGDRLTAIPFAVLTVGFLPAAWASVAATPNRQRILRGTVIGCLLVVFVGTFLLESLAIGVLLMIPTTLIAIAAGLVFQGRRGR